MKNTTEIKIEEVYCELRKKVETVVGYEILAPRDFDYLSVSILEKTKLYLSPITLKRFWGYINEEKKRKPFRSTLNILSQYAGYTGFEAFEKNFSNSGAVESDFLPNDSLQTITLSKGSVIDLRWQPDRRVIVQYEGLDMFKVVESTNSKLCVGDTFMCGLIINGEPLQLRCLVQKGKSPVNYVCGRVNGVKFRLL